MGENFAQPHAVIRVHRPAAAWRDLVRKYWIEINGVRAGQIGNDQQLDFPVPPGVYDVRAAIDWSGSRVVRVELAPGQTADLTVEPAGSSFQFWQAFTRQGYLRLTRT
ncbi:hypothetical protein [Lentzea flaviverrucosa]|uniref:Uncharacterized protein n=1 Tax=Lentzea flaviverrucosa TaxID=200379 RepID=A0A1H9XU40_9PSEU|nr:hypothetical protein [Lentzea flaviverrucosa]RDI18893.1 hypothetical protein DFR72_118224 [Lentzea flaviverrucosa]SES49636.1 hypothetical protein SAMN05216195_11811 [Lentzea flaviverrucosa]